MIYKPTQEDLDVINNFVEGSYRYHHAYGRSGIDIKSDIFVGKLGELAFHRLFPQSTAPNFEISVTADPGWDLMMNGNRVQIKTIRSGSKWVSFNDWNWDELAVLSYEQFENTISFLHINTKSYLKQNAKKSNFRGWYFPS
jgi:hypothetical protein